MQSRIGCIGLIFLKSWFSKVFSKCLPQLIHSHIGCILTIFLQSEFSNVASKRLPQQMQSRIGYICFIFLLNEFSIVPSESTYAHSWIITLIASFLHSKQLDLSDGVWPSHHLTDVEQPSKTIKYEGIPKNHQQTIEHDGYPQPFHSKVIVALRTIKKDVNLTTSGPALPNIKNITE